MSNRRNMAMVAGLCVVMILGFVFFRKSASTPAPAVGEQQMDISSGPAVAVEETPGEFTGEKMEWNPLESGCAVEVKEGEVHIVGATNQTGWNHWNGVASGADIPEGDFTASVDIKVARFEGDTQYKNPYLRVESANGQAIGVFADPECFYRLHDWQEPQVQSDTHKSFGDEARKFHRLELKWDAAAQTATATVDGEPIGSIKSSLGGGGRLKFMLVTNTETRGVDIDVTFRNFKLVVPALKI